MFQRPRTQYVRSGDVEIAYQVSGDADIDLVMIPGSVSHLDMDLDDPAYVAVLERLTSFCRVIRFDKRGTGLSARNIGSSGLDERIEDLQAVMDAVGVESSAIMGVSEGSALGMVFAATFPERVKALILCGSFPLAGDIDPDARAEAIKYLERFTAYIESSWGEGGIIDFVWPSMAGNPEVRKYSGRYERAAASPREALESMRWLKDAELAAAARSVSVPTLVLHRTEERLCPVSVGRWLGENIPGARYVEEHGDAHLLEYGDPTLFLNEIEEFLTGSHIAQPVNRVLATVLFTDIVNSTDQLSELGDKGWRDLLARHHSVVRHHLARYRGREIDTAGDGFFASFDGPARAIQCAVAIRDALQSMGVEIRAGVHTGECERDDNKLVGIAVHTGARIMGQARAGQVLVSSTVRSLVAGSGLSFNDAGEHELKGIPELLHLYSVA